jgi:hypothetical protein
MKRFKAAKIEFKQFCINENTMYTLLQRDYKEPKMVIVYESNDTIQSGHNTLNTDGGGQIFN